MSRTHIPGALRERVAAAAKGRCGYCRSAQTVTGIPLTIDHIKPESLGGETAEDNLWMACQPCNGHKAFRIGAADPVTGEVVPLFDPRRQVWADHFLWADGGTRIVGRTPTGRATVEVLQLNRRLVVSARQRWIASGDHPPAD